jgi:hypothetical protein
MLIVNDLGAHCPSRLKGAFEANPNVGTLIVFEFDNQGAKDQYWKLKHLEGAPTTLLSTIPPASKTPGVPGAARPHNSKHSSRAFVLDETCQKLTELPNSDWWKQESVDLKKDKGVYVELDHFTVALGAVTTGGTVPMPAWLSAKEFLAGVKDLRKAGLITDATVYGFKKDALGKLGSGWKPLKDSIAEKLDELIKKKKLGQIMADYNVVHGDGFKPILSTSFAKQFPAASAMGKYLAAVEEATHPKLEAMVKAVHIAANRGLEKHWITIPALPPPSREFVKEGTSLLDTYPLLKLIGQWERLHTKDVTSYVEYVKLIGK